MIYFLWRQSEETGILHAYREKEKFSVCLKSYLPTKQYTTGEVIICQECRHICDGKEKDEL